MPSRPASASTISCDVSCRACRRDACTACSGVARCGSTVGGSGLNTSCRRVMRCVCRRPVPSRGRRRRHWRRLCRSRSFFEDKRLLVIDKPSGIAVHGGSGISHGVIELLRHARPELKDLSLVHRLDRETSGCLVLAKTPQCAARAARALS